MDAAIPDAQPAAVQWLVSANGVNDGTTLAATLRAAARGRPAARGGVGIGVQVVLIYLWHVAVIMFGPLADGLSGVGRAMWWGEATPAGSSEPFAESMARWCAGLFSTAPDVFLLVLGELAGVVAIEALVAFLIMGLVVPLRRLTVGLFVRSWWRTCLWATLILPAILLCAPALWTDRSGDSPVFPASAAVLVFGPAWLANGDLPRRLRVARWRPVCPECGYSLRRLARENCPECGVAFPTTARAYRRWANRRLAWDRANRGSILVAYLKTALQITFQPWRAARGVMVPDRLPRAARWAVAHLLVFALLGVVLGSQGYYPYWARSQFEDREGWELIGITLPTLHVVAPWAGQSFLAWLIALAALPVWGIALGAVIAGGRAVVGRNLAKWSLYALVVLPLPALAWYAVSLLRWIQSGPLTVGGMPWPGRGFRVPWYPATPPVVLLAVVYGVWWAAGVAVNVYLRRRGFREFVAHAVLYVVSWLVLVGLFFRPGPLTSLL